MRELLFTVSERDLKFSRLHRKYQAYQKYGDLVWCGHLWTSGGGLLYMNVQLDWVLVLFLGLSGTTTHWRLADMLRRRAALFLHSLLS